MRSKKKERRRASDDALPEKAECRLLRRRRKRVAWTRELSRVHARSKNGVFIQIRKTWYVIIA